MQPTVFPSLYEWLLPESSHLPLQSLECRSCVKENFQGALPMESQLSHRWPDLGGHQEHADHDILFLAWEN